MLETIDVLPDLRTWSDKAHLTLQNVEELR